MNWEYFTPLPLCLKTQLKHDYWIISSNSPSNSMVKNKKLTSPDVPFELHNSQWIYLHIDLGKMHALYAAALMFVMCNNCLAHHNNCMQLQRLTYSCMQSGNLIRLIAAAVVSVLQRWETRVFVQTFFTLQRGVCVSIVWSAPLFALEECPSAALVYAINWNAPTFAALCSSNCAHQNN